jgi:type VI secretion system secreted protein Hcp
MAAIDYFLKIDGIKGEAQDKSHKDEIDVKFFEWHMEQKGTAAKGGGMGAGRVFAHDLRIVKQIDASTPKLFDACFSGKHIPSATLTCRKAGGTQLEYYVHKLTDILISSVRHKHQDDDGGQTGADVSNEPIEEILINISSYEIQYKQQNKDGSGMGAIIHKGDLKQLTNS